MKTLVLILIAAAVGCVDSKNEPNEGDSGVSEAADAGAGCDGSENECGGCGEVKYELQSVPIGRACAYYWNEDNSGDCSTVGVGRCKDANTVICDAPKPDCAP